MAYSSKQQYSGRSVSKYDDRSNSLMYQDSPQKEVSVSYRSYNSWEQDSDDEYNCIGEMAGDRSSLDVKLSNDRELSTKMLSVDQKRFYLYLRENDFGRFIRILEKTKNFANNKIILPEGLLAEFVSILKEFSYKAQDKRAYLEATQGRYSDIIARKTLKQHSKSIFIELRENAMGKFVKITSLLRQNRQHIIIPAAGISALNSVIETMMQESAMISREDVSDPENSPEKGDEVFSSPQELMKSDKPLEENVNTQLGSIASMLISSQMYFDVVCAADQELELKITDSTADKSLFIPRKNWTSCMKALQMLIDKYPLPTDLNSWM